MTPSWLCYCAPVAQALCTVLILRSVHSWRVHPALFLWLTGQTFVQAFALRGGYPYLSLLSSAQLAIWTAVYAEHLVFERLARFRNVALAAGLAASLLRLALPTHYSRQLFRSYYLLALAAAYLALALYRAVRPLPRAAVLPITGQPQRARHAAPCRRHRAYLLGAAAWTGAMAALGAFVPGGLGYRLLPYTAHRRELLDLAGYLAIPLIVAAMTAGMLATAPRPKRAARTGDAWLARAA